jgi:hypothetical protein
LPHLQTPMRPEDAGGRPGLHQEKLARHADASLLVAAGVRVLPRAPPLIWCITTYQDPKCASRKSVPTIRDAAG